MLILIFTTYEIPLTLCFAIKTDDIHTAYGAFVLTIDLILCVDVLLNFRTAYFHPFDELRLVSDPSSVAKNYAKHWFLIDLITSFPIEFRIPQNIELGGAPTLLRALRIVRLIRLFKLVRFFRMLKLVNTLLREFMGPRGTLILRLFRLLAFMVMAAHLAACVWFYVGSLKFRVGGLSNRRAVAVATQCELSK